MSIPQANTLVGDQISRSYIFMEDTLKRGLAGVASLKHLSPVANIKEAALYGAFATFARQYPTFCNEKGSVGSATRTL